MGNKYLSEVLSPKDIFAHEKILLVAGVGAGKNTFFEQKFSKYKVLLVTSMRAKVDETNNRLGANKNIDCMTYFQFAEMWREWCAGERSLTHNRIFDYDLIVLDEAHALMIDATFAADRVVILDYLHYREFVQRKNANQTIILCTATPQPLYEYCGVNDYFMIDVRETCINILPKKVVITTLEQFLSEIEEDDKKNVKPFSYLANKRETLDDLASTLDNRYGLKNIRTFCADEKVDLDKVDDTLFSTQVAREGINVNNKQPAIVAVETHDMLIAYQYAGRFRHGVDVLYILWNVPNYKQRIKSSQNNLAMFLAACPEESATLDDETLLETTGGFAYRSYFKDEVMYNTVKKNSIMRQKKIFDDFKEDPKGAVFDYFGLNGNCVRYDFELCQLSTKDGRKALKETNRSNYAKFEKIIDSMYDEKKDTTTNEWLVDGDTLDGILKLSHEFSIKSERGKTSHTKPARVLKQFGYHVDYVTTNPKYVERYHSRLVRKKNKVYYD